MRVYDAVKMAFMIPILGYCLQKIAQIEDSLNVNINPEEAFKYIKRFLFSPLAYFPIFQSFLQLDKQNLLRTSVQFV